MSKCGTCGFDFHAARGAGVWEAIVEAKHAAYADKKLAALEAENARLRAENERLLGIVNWIRKRACVILWIVPMQYPIEHNPNTGKDSWDLLMGQMLCEAAEAAKETP